MNGASNFNICTDGSQRKFSLLSDFLDDNYPNPLFAGRTIQNVKVEDKPALYPESQSTQPGLFADSQLSSFKISTVKTDPDRHCPLEFNEIAVSLATNTDNADKPQSGPLNHCLAGTDKMPREQAATKSLPAIESRSEGISQNNRPSVDDTESSSSNIVEPNNKKAVKKRKRKVACLTGVSKKRRLANERERNRMEIVRGAMGDLKGVLCGSYFPEETRNVKIKDIEILRGAINYIKILNDMLANSSPEQSQLHSA
ncbi:helix-loop-helix domain-containing protein [Thalassotalea sp. G20_0]|uniref:helix-loop-helix domain-containing protein n=1 Tax=Thalassotalea sp. G20_0 TaxID=2821093 RepID=UPI001ADC6594|nr:helix-loop-helix domain-containing protein [Thalassotalea sp. G20_0]MBO9493483.1 helix-loop-helix domain-containing protein [Thalassotalea sp. G20_0]